MTKLSTILVVDDRIEARALIATELEEAGFRVIEAADGAKGFAQFRRESPDLVVSDVRMPGADGIQLLRRIREVSRVPVILLSGHADIPTAVTAMKRGAQEFLTFPDDLDFVIERAKELLRDTRRSAQTAKLEEVIAGRSARMRRVRERIQGLAPLPVHVLVCGESGTGRDLAVTALHQLSPNSELPLLALAACSPAAAKPPTAIRAVYLDGVGRLPPDAQLRWLHRLREADGRNVPSPLRVYASTAEDLAGRAREDSFHPELASRLLRFTIDLPPLRDHLEDIAPLLSVLVPRIGARLGRGRVRVLPSAIARLKQHPWAGNVRELSEAVERLIAFTPGGVISRAQVDQVLRATPESVSRYVSEGQFGLWSDTGTINDIINDAYKNDLGMGEAIGAAIDNGDFPHKDVSILGACYRTGVPATVHVGVGFDIIHEHANCDGAATGETSYRDFLAFTSALESLDGGVIANFGSAVMAPEVFLKALSMVRNVAHQKDERIARFATLVCDIRKLPDDLTAEPPKDEAAYYFRPLKTMLVRTVADGGESFYVRGAHADTVPALWSAINEAEAR